MNWIDTQDGHHCNVHDVDFLRGEVCTGCTTAPGNPIEVVPSSDDIDKQLRAEAAAHRSLSKFLHRAGKAVLEEGTTRERADACKLIGEGTKLARLAGELEDRVSNRQHDRFLVAHEERMSGQRGEH